ncbi:MAG: tRNA (N(6)-L-threonylcarbamoyladenosine(37)-C(2))-methylthiotransferase MtaB [Candidatus Cloacimonetes bacterium]|nr:tRNA (N(6)-L-threonylcarbamoyladenosine(37)-C(2))-methylthiotransferase MtaB [Candidatus Cloacimonadota bacterium]
MLQIHIETLGCKINHYESACIYDNFFLKGFVKAETIDSADIIIINTCTVTNRSDFKSRNLINKAKAVKQKNHSVKIIVTGCYSQRNKEEVMASGYVDLVVDNNQKEKIVEYKHLINNIPNPINEQQQTNYQSDAKNQIPKFQEIESFIEFSELNMNIMSERSRAFLKIQDGCDFKCSYCAVPFARGKPRSRSLKSILDQVDKFLSYGYEELVLSGVNLGLYSSEGYDLSDLLQKLSEYKNNKNEIKRIRLGSLEPQLFTEKLCQTLKDIEKICPHFHIPLQTGSDELLQLHNRGYTVEDFIKVVDSLQKIKPNSAVGLDVIVGLPNETEELFEKTFNLLKNMEFTYLHVFIYSKRKGTLAASMKGQIHGTIAKERSKWLLDLSMEKKNEFINKLIEEQVGLNAVQESYDLESRLWRGTSDRYLKVYSQNADDGQQDKHKLLKFLPKSRYLDGVLCEKYLY